MQNQDKFELGNLPDEVRILTTSKEVSFSADGEDEEGIGGDSILDGKRSDVFYNELDAVGTADDVHGDAKSVAELIAYRKHTSRN